MVSSSAGGYDPSPAVLSILFDIYWSRAGWHSEPHQPAPDDLHVLLTAGVAFPPGPEMTHDDVVDRVRGLVAATEQPAVANAFVASLSSRRLDLRSALGSFAVARHLPAHDFQPTQDRLRCEVCGLYAVAARADDDRNILSFERFKWGGVRRNDLVYVAFDLEQFHRAPKVSPGPDDRETLREIVAALDSVPAGTTSSQLPGLLTRHVKGTKQDRGVLLEILGATGVLATAAHPGFLDRWVPWIDRTLPSRRFVDMSYPTCWWNAADGVDRQILHRLFPTEFG